MNSADERMRWAVTYLDSKTGLRTLAYAAQGRNLHDSEADARAWAEAVGPSLCERVLHVPLSALAVRPVACYGNGDPKGIYFDD